MTNSTAGIDPAPPGKYPIKKILVDSDLDGITCGAMLSTVYPEVEIFMGEATGMQEGAYDHLVDEFTAIADLKYVDGCGLYFDHHSSNRPQNDDFPGRWDNADSAANVVYEYFKDHFDLSKFDEIIPEVNKFDMGKLTREEFLNPSDVIKLGMSIIRMDHEFNMLLIKLLREEGLSGAMQDLIIKQRVDETLDSRNEVIEYIKANSEVKNGIGIIDMTEFGSDVRVSSFVFISVFPEVDAVLVLKPDKKSGTFKGRFYRNNFNSDAYAYDLLEAATKINPDKSGGHKTACGFNPKPGMSKDIVVDLAMNYLGEQQIS